MENKITLSFNNNNIINNNENNYRILLQIL